MTKGRILGVFILASWLGVHGYFMAGYLSKWEKLMKPGRWEYFSSGKLTGWAASGFPDFSMKSPKGWLTREGLAENSRDDAVIYFSVSPYEQIFSDVSALNKYPYGDPSLQDVHKEALSFLRKKFLRFTPAAEPAYYQNEAKKTAILMTEFQAQIPRLISSPVKIYGVAVSYDGLSYGASSYGTASRRPAYFVVLSREKYFKNMKRIFLEMVGSVEQ